MAGTRGVLAVLLAFFVWGAVVVVASGEDAGRGGGECSGTIFCDNATGRCLEGHALNAATGLCSGCGNGVVDTGEECDGSAHCVNATCRCTLRYAPAAASGGGACVPVCGDGFVAPGEECDSTPFCHSVTCRCLVGHPLNAATQLCSGCGNGEVDDGEECDGGCGCTPQCTCASSFVPANPRNTYCEYCACNKLLLLMLLLLVVLLSRCC